MKIFGREPAMLLSMVYAGIVLFGGHVLHLDGTKQGALNIVAAAVVGLIVAVMARSDGTAATIYGLLKAILAAIVAFGLDLPAALQADIMTFVSVALMYMTRQSITAPLSSDGEGGQTQGSGGGG